MNLLGDYYRQEGSDVVKSLGSRENGLDEKEVAARRKLVGYNVIHERQIDAGKILLRQVFGNPLNIILVIATLISFFLGERVSSFYIFVMIFVSIVLGFWNEYSAEKTIEGLLKKIAAMTVVVRDGEKKELLVKDLVIGDIVLLTQGDVLPADVRFLETKNFEVNESALTGESISVAKIDSPINRASDISEMKNIGFMGTNVVSGSAKAIVLRIGRETEYGKIAKLSSFVKPSTEFEKGLTDFGQLIVKLILLLTVVIFVVNFFLKNSFIDSLLFALAIAVGLTPELLPVIVTICLSHGAGKLAKKHVVTKQLIAIENLGNIDVLCTDKTGTLTEGKIELVDYFNRHQQKDKDILLKGLMCNTAVLHHKIIGNGIDVAIRNFADKEKFSLPAYKKIDEESFDYERQAMFTVIKKGEKRELIVKGSPEAVSRFCHGQSQKEILSNYSKLNQQGYRVVAVASKSIGPKDSYSWQDVTEMNYLGMMTFLDTPKKTAKNALITLNNLNIKVKVITGDSPIITKKICSEVGLPVEKILIGEDLEKMNSIQLKKAVNETDIFARVTPETKLKIIQTIRESGHTVGYMGDGINDVLALRNADVGISVNTAVDVAKNTASVVLLRKSLRVLTDGIVEGRRTFNNTIKYIMMSTSSNFGNMFSAAGASFFLPYLPMTPVQILLTNGLYDVSQMSIPSDNVDNESLVKPRHWNIGFIKNYMLFFGPLSSLYDFLTFGLMIYIFKAKDSLFQTGWFVESVLTEILVVFVIRTARTPFFKSRPGTGLLLTCISMCLIAVVLPISPLAKPLGLTGLPPLYFVLLIVLVSTYLLLVEFVKNRFLKKYSL